jgi:hypothetical protein
VGGGLYSEADTWLSALRHRLIPALAAQRVHGAEDRAAAMAAPGCGCPRGCTTSPACGPRRRRSSSGTTSITRAFARRCCAGRAQAALRRRVGVRALPAPRGGARLGALRSRRVRPPRRQRRAAGTGESAVTARPRLHERLGRWGRRLEHRWTAR